ncbi:MAG: hypothetical protein ABIH46_01090 [Chloroflexota bacterium]
MNRTGKQESTRGKCFCPYCEQELAAAPHPICQPCGITLRYCTKCKIVVGKEAKVCPQCGGDVQ